MLEGERALRNGTEIRQLNAEDAAECQAVFFGVLQSSRFPRRRLVTESRIEHAATQNLRNALEVVLSELRKGSDRQWGENLRGFASHVLVWGSGIFDALEERPQNRRKPELVVELRQQSTVSPL